MKKLGGWLFIFYLCSNCAIAQGGSFEMGIHAGTAIYQGDLTPFAFGSYKTIRYSAGVYANFIISDALSFRPNFDFGTIEGDDSKYSHPAWRQQRNFKFERSFKEASALLVWDVFARNYDEMQSGFSPYLFAGAGYSFLNGHNDYSRFNAAAFIGEPDVLHGLKEDLEQPELKVMPVVPVGVGVRISLTPHTSANAELSYRLSATDYLDGFSKAADTRQMDRYYTFSVGLSISPGKKRADNKIKCPPAGR
jgi:hypothetical protein